MTETVCRLGAAAALVGCTRYCTEPAAALDGVRRVGGTKNPKRETIAALAPDLILANAEENRGEDIEWLAARWPVLVQTPRTIAAAIAALHELAARIGGEEPLRPIQARLDALLARSVGQPAGRKRPRVYYAIWARPWMTVGKDTFIHDLLLHGGADNVAAAAPERYPALAPEDAVRGGIDAVLLASEPWAFDAQQRAALARDRLFGDAQLVLCDGRDFCWHGVHMVVGLRRAWQLLDTLAIAAPGC